MYNNNKKANEGLYQDLLLDFKIYDSLNLSCRGSGGNPILRAIKTPRTRLECTRGSYLSWIRWCGGHGFDGIIGHLSP